MGFRLLAFGVEDTETGEHIVPGHRRWAEWEAALAKSDFEPMRTTPAISRDEALARRLGEIEEVAAGMRRRVTGAVSAQEMASWAVKLQQARTYQAGDLVNCAMINLEAKARGVTPEDIARRILANADAFSAAEAMIAGAAGKHKDAVRRLAGAADILLYDVAAGWSLTPPAPIAELPPREKPAPIDP